MGSNPSSALRPRPVKSSTGVLGCHRAECWPRGSDCYEVERPFASGFHAHRYRLFGTVTIIDGIPARDPPEIPDEFLRCRKSTTSGTEECLTELVYLSRIDLGAVGIVAHKVPAAIGLMAHSGAMAYLM
jgi:hypothetical protein